MYMRERERERQRQRQTDRQTDRQSDRDRDRERLGQLKTGADFRVYIYSVLQIMF